MTISIRLHLHTEAGPVGPRLERGTPMPAGPYHFPDTEDGRKAAEAKRDELAEYVGRHHSGKKGKR